MMQTLSNIIQKSNVTNLTLIKGLTAKKKCYAALIKQKNIDKDEFVNGTNTSIRFIDYPHIRAE